MNELSIIDNYCNITKTALSFKREVSKDEWQKVFDTCNHIEGCIQFWIGDLLKYREQKWGMYDDVADKIGIDKGTLRKYKETADSIESGIRIPDLSFTHHRQVSSFEPEKQKEFLNMASEKKWSVSEMREAVKKDRQKLLLNSQPEFKKKRYRVIYADPPWEYGQMQHTRVEQETTLEKHYPTMPTEVIAYMPVSEIADENSVLFLWTTSPKLYEAKQVIDGWGFEYKASIVWDKIKHNVGYYVSVRHEFLLIATRGSCLPDFKKLEDSVVSIERTEHSRKPDHFREWIDRLYTFGNKLEIFARTKTKGWDTYGNQLSDVL